MLYNEVQGGDALLAWFGQVPSFHDAEIIGLSLARTGASELKIHGWIMTDAVDPHGYFILDRHAVVTFRLEGIMDLQLDCFSGQNVIAGLVLQRATDRGRSAFYAMPQEASDIEIQLLPCYGIHGVIRVKAVSISFVPGHPLDAI